jgi:hypothetical protein
MNMLSTLSRLTAIFLCWLILAPQCLAYTYTRSVGFTQTEAMQASEILGVRAHLDRLLSNNQDEDTILLKSLILRKILLGVLEVRQACNKIDLELTYAYDVMKKEQRKEQYIFSLFNLANFAQLSTFYTLEPCMRMHKQFVTSAIFTPTSGSLSTGISTCSKLYGHMAKASHVAPPKILAGIVDGKPVDTSGMPPLVTQYLDSKSLDSDKTHREELFAMWKHNYHIDPAKTENLGGIADKNKASLGLLRTRILLLWSLHTYVQDFDRELLALLQLIKGPPQDNPAFSKSVASSVKYRAGTAEAVHLINIQPQIDELVSLRNTDSKRHDELELFVLEKTLESALEIQVASDKVDEELNYNYHIVLAQLLQSRAKWLQWNYNLNFLQSGIMGIVAGRLYLSHFTYAGDRQFVISGGIGTGLTTLAILQMHGFWRKVDTPPNSLAQVLNLEPDSEYRFSPLVSNYLNAVPPGSTDGLTRRESLNEAWKKNHVTTMNLDRKKSLEALAAMPPHKYDTIKIVTNRNVLLQSLKKELESFQADTFGLLRVTDPANTVL